MPLPSSRLPWIDHLRTLVILLVVNMHASVTYSHVGDWYVKSVQEPTLNAKIPFILWQALLQSFFMGLLFFVSVACGLSARRSVLRALPFDRPRVRLERPDVVRVRALDILPRARRMVRAD